MGVHVSRLEELIWAIHIAKQLQIISNILLFKTAIPLKTIE